MKLLVCSFCVPARQCSAAHLLPFQNRHAASCKSVCAATVRAQTILQQCVYSLHQCIRMPCPLQLRCSSTYAQAHLQSHCSPALRCRAQNFYSLLSLLPALLLFPPVPFLARTLLRRTPTRSPFLRQRHFTQVRLCGKSFFFYSRPKSGLWWHPCRPHAGQGRGLSGPGALLPGTLEWLGEPGVAGSRTRRALMRFARRGVSECSI